MKRQFAGLIILVFFLFSFSAYAGEPMNVTKVNVNKILSYTTEKIDFYKESIKSEKLAEVQTKVITSSKEVPIFYRLIKKDGAWRVYDVVVENVSLVQNYRTQFNDILAKNTPEQLLEILRKKEKEQ